MGSSLEDKNPRLTQYTGPFHFSKIFLYTILLCPGCTYSRRLCKSASPHPALFGSGPPLMWMGEARCPRADMSEPRFGVDGQTDPLLYIYKEKKARPATSLFPTRP